MPKYWKRYFDAAVEEKSLVSVGALSDASPIVPSRVTYAASQSVRCETSQYPKVELDRAKERLDELFSDSKTTWRMLLLKAKLGLRTPTERERRKINRQTHGYNKNDYKPIRLINGNDKDAEDADDAAIDDYIANMKCDNPEDDYEHDTDDDDADKSRPSAKAHFHADLVKNGKKNAKRLKKRQKAETYQQNYQHYPPGKLHPKQAMLLEDEQQQQSRMNQRRKTKKQTGKKPPYQLPYQHATKDFQQVARKAPFLQPVDNGGAGTSQPLQYGVTGSRGGDRGGNARKKKEQKKQRRKYTYRDDVVLIQSN